MFAYNCCLKVWRPYVTLFEYFLFLFYNTDIYKIYSSRLHQHIFAAAGSLGVISMGWRARFVLGLALQQASALPSELHCTLNWDTLHPFWSTLQPIWSTLQHIWSTLRTLSELRYNLSGLRCTLSKLRCNLSGLRCTLSDLRCTLSDLRCTLSDLRCTLSDLRCTLSKLRRTLKLCSYLYLSPKSKFSSPLQFKKELLNKYLLTSWNSFSYGCFFLRIP